MKEERRNRPEGHRERSSPKDSEADRRQAVGGRETDTSKLRKNKGSWRSCKGNRGHQGGP